MIAWKKVESLGSHKKIILYLVPYEEKKGWTSDTECFNIFVALTI